MVIITREEEGHFAVGNYCVKTQQYDAAIEQYCKAILLIRKNIARFTISMKKCVKEDIVKDYKERLDAYAEDETKYTEALKEALKLQGFSENDTEVYIRKYEQ